MVGKISTAIHSVLSRSKAECTSLRDSGAESDIEWNKSFDPNVTSDKYVFGAVIIYMRIQIHCKQASIQAIKPATLFNRAGLRLDKQLQYLK